MCCSAYAACCMPRDWYRGRLFGRGLDGVWALARVVVVVEEEEEEEEEEELPKKERRSFDIFSSTGAVETEKRDCGRRPTNRSMYEERVGQNGN
jgi:hypothetical protein